MTLHEQEVASTAAGLTGVAQQTAARMLAKKREGQHPLFSAVHSILLAHRYGDQFDMHPLDYYNHPELRSAHTRMAMGEGLQYARQRFGRGPQSGGAPPPAGPVPQPGGAPPQPTMPRPYTFNPAPPGGYSKPMTPPGTTFP